MIASPTQGKPFGLPEAAVKGEWSPLDTRVAYQVSRAGYRRVDGWTSSDVDEGAVGSYLC